MGVGVAVGGLGVNVGEGGTTVGVEEGGGICVGIGCAVAGKETISGLSVWGGKPPRTSKTNTTATRQLRDNSMTTMVIHCLGEILLMLTPGPGSDLAPFQASRCPFSGLLSRQTTSKCQVAVEHTRPC